MLQGGLGLLWRPVNMLMSFSGGIGSGFRDLLEGFLCFLVLRF